MNDARTARADTFGSADAYRTSDDPGLDRLKVVLGGWQDSLLDMGGRNRLLNFRHTRTSTLEIAAPAGEELLGRLTGSGWGFADVAEEGADTGGISLAKEGDFAGAVQVGNGIVTQKATQAGLDRALTELRCKSGQMYNDYGLWVLWLGVGMLEWREAGAHESSAAPLVLVPVELTRDVSGSVRLRAAEGQDAIHNPAVAVKLAQLGVVWEAVSGLDCADTGAVLDAARDVAERQEGWAVGDRAVLAMFASHKEAMYQDLKEHEAAVLADPLIRAIGLGPDAGLPDDVIGFDPPPLERIDEVQLPERTPLVLDADASQRQCIAAAMEHRSFVMSGPPGTGKSQTITNMIAALMHAGRSVLFVSEKAAALDVVRNRLNGVGLGDFVLALHSSAATKKAVAQELGRALLTEVPASGAADHELAEAARLRSELSAYAAAMNEVREPLGRSLHEVMGRVVLLEQEGTPALPLASGSSGSLGSSGPGSSGTLSAQVLLDVLRAARSVSRSWRPVMEGASFAWRGLRDAEELGRPPLGLVEEAVDALDALYGAADRRPLAAAAPSLRTVRDIESCVHELRGQLPQGKRDSATVLPGDQSMQAAQLADSFGLDKPVDAAGALALCELADLAEREHRPAPGWFARGALARARSAAAELRQAVTALDAAREAAQDVFTEQVLACEENELDALARRFAEDHQGFTARFKGQFRMDRAAVAALSRTGVWDKVLAARLAEALAWKRADATVRLASDQYAALLGPYVPGGDDGFGPLDAALATASRIEELAPGAGEFSRMAARLAHDAEVDPLVRLQVRAVRGALADWCDVAERRSARWSDSVSRVVGMFDDGRQLQLYPSLRGTFEDAGRELRVLLADPSGPEEWQAYGSGLAVLERQGVADLVGRSAERGFSAEQLPAVVERAVLQSWADTVLATDPRLRTTRSADLDARVEDFREADLRMVAAASGAVIEACNKRKPRAFGGGGAGLIIREAEKKTRHMAVRDLLGRAREVVQAVKPCFMMSPLTVSQFLPADYRFDVVIFDEASQVRPGDAVNCIYRGRSLIVAGDEKQLPPTSFFDSAVGDESEEYDEDVPDSFESLLDACKAGAMRSLPLRWHYRSRHEDLITFSNRSFYENSMVTFPGARDKGADVGVEFFKADGVYDRGGRRDNRIEADFVAQRVLHHFDTRPGRTLGVVALSQAQASAIELAVQQARLMRPDLDHCFTEGRLDGFFVKNLESVQGDERDVMIMSIGYGPDERGVLGLNFGPVNKDGGWRRLNVAVTRARFRMEVVASFHGTRLKDSDNVSVQHLKRYLEYAADGPAVLSRDVLAVDGEPESPFEESVLGVLRGWGYTVQPQVGVAGFRIDMGLRHPAAPGAYALGIECDGAMYHSSRAARDRDRLREQVLEGLGWTLHRIWGTDWYRNRPEAERRLKAAVEEAVARDPYAGSARAGGAGAAGAVGGAGIAEVTGAAGVAGAVEGPVAVAGVAEGASDARGVLVAAAAPVADLPVPAVERVLPARVPVDRVPDRPWSSAYRVADIRVSTPVEMHTSEARPALRRVITRIVETEGPVHEDLLVQRAREAWGLGRAGSRIRDNVRDVLRNLGAEGVVVLDGSFVDVAGRSDGPAARTPVDACVRKVAQVAPVERRFVLVRLAAECPGMTAEELLLQVREFFGWKRMGTDIRATLEADIAALYAQGRLGERQGFVFAAEGEQTGAGR
jgi:very-short-patch-repair endonuclease